MGHSFNCFYPWLSLWCTWTTHLRTYLQLEWVAVQAASQLDVDYYCRLQKK